MSEGDDLAPRANIPDFRLSAGGGALPPPVPPRPSPSNPAAPPAPTTNPFDAGDAPDPPFAPARDGNLRVPGNLEF